MPVDERARRKLHERLVVALGDEAADTLMAEMGSLGREQLATRHDVLLGFANAERDRATMHGELSAQIANLRAENKDDFGRLSLDLAKQTRQLGIWMLASQTTLAGIIFAAARL